MHQLSSKFRKIFAKIFSSQISKGEAPYEDISSRGKAEVFVHLYFSASIEHKCAEVGRPRAPQKPAIRGDEIWP